MYHGFQQCLRLCVLKNEFDRHTKMTRILISGVLVFMLGRAWL